MAKSIVQMLKKKKKFYVQHCVKQVYVLTWGVKIQSLNTLFPNMCLLDSCYKSSDK